MKHSIRFSNGETVPPGLCVQSTMTHDVFTLRVESLNGVTMDDIIRLIHSKYKVKKITHEEKVTYIRLPAQLK